MKNIKRIRNQRCPVEEKVTQLPGPGSYEIGLPIIKPSYEAIRKSEDIIILKVKDHSESVSFRSNIERFPNEKQLSPGPAFYSKEIDKSKEKNEIKKLNRKYYDLIEFMNKDKPKVEPTPNYTVEYGDEYVKSMKSIKNSYRKHKKERRSLEESKQTKISRVSQQSVFSIKSKGRYEKNYVQDTDSKQYKTIDYPGQQTKLKASKKEEEQKFMFHRKTLFNRNMLGVMFVKGKNHQQNKLN